MMGLTHLSAPAQASEPDGHPLLVEQLESLGGFHRTW